MLSKTNGPTVFHDHAVGHAHIDTVYLWPKRETRRKIGRTVANVLALMDQDDEFVFAMSSAQQFAWLEEDYPDLFRRVKERIGEGRFIFVGGMWVKADAMMPSGESLVRQITYGRRNCKDHLGVSPKGVWLPDSFVGIQELSRRLLEGLDTPGSSRRNCPGMTQPNFPIILSFGKESTAARY